MKPRRRSLLKTSLRWQQSQPKARKATVAEAVVRTRRTRNPRTRVRGRAEAPGTVQTRQRPVVIAIIDTVRMLGFVPPP